MSTDSKAQFRFIEARNLSLSPINVRKTGGENGIDQLADLIAAEGVLQNLDVYECEGGEGKKRQLTRSSPAVVGGVQCSFSSVRSESSRTSRCRVSS
jgi:hypothetical protein